MSTGGYHVQELPPDPRILSGMKYRGYLYCVAQTAVWTFQAYFVLRLVSILSSPVQTWQMWATLAIEGMFALLSRQDQLLTVASGRAPPNSPRKRLRLQGDENLPTVEVLLPCCGEPVEVILDTIRAACTLDYPATRFRVRVLDDGGSAALRSAVTELQARWPHLSYHSRGRQTGQVFAKSGNLNYALQTLQAKTPPEFCAIFDADSIAAPEFLRATLPHLLATPEAVLVTTRQYFYNLPRGDPFSQSRLHFYTCQNTELDLQRRAIDAGSGALFRRRAIVDAGGYPTYSFSEDWQLSLVLQGLGHETIQVQEPLQFGLVPTSLAGHIAQQSRWHIGHTQQTRVLVAPTNATMSRAMQWGIVLNGLAITGRLVALLAIFVAVPALLLTAQPLIPTTPTHLKPQLILATAHVTLSWLFAALQSAHTDFQSAPFAHLENTWLAGAHLLALLRFHLISPRPKKGSFVTGSTTNTSNRTAAAAPTSLQNLSHNLWDNGIGFSALLLCATISAFTLALWRGVSHPTSPSVLKTLLTGAAFPPMLHITFLVTGSLLEPVVHLLAPPVFPDRNAGLEVSGSGVRQPTAAVRAACVQQRKSMPGFVGRMAVVGVGLAAVGVGVWWL
ncbi:glycosyltransferase family 2 protein [Aspergillus brunneoviolaceus CBS 621.78]|uniref:Nucleotide-diphospho-sugar transferase n=1 Tax=Aspergillus brunneoviolaceus CBS 621.78 TaxID=1450534 RepID=A0ACD1G7V0_9EURO|nr:nucleotide-diphospho-sugar transferase [Aspergillus brunneoviolaceus CBS 621.78]RAH45295.1 nucleotide-diphospho-sugar transferase [Aspergillus brunneoviolaceus CBS 621.78]